MNLTSSDDVSTKSKAYSLLDGGALAVAVYTIVLFLIPAELWLHWGTVPERAVSRSLSVPVEIRVLIACVLLSLALPLALIAIHIRQFGGPMVRSNRDAYPATTGVAARIGRAHANLIESLVPFAAAVLSAHAFDISNSTTVSASVVYLAARFVHAVTYTLGITVIRSSAFYAGVIATVVIATQLPLLH